MKHKFKILLIGDSCVDEYYIGNCDRLSPEAPVPIIKIIDHYSLPGMAGNVRKNFIALGVDPEYITNIESIVKTRYIDQKSGQQLIRVDTEPYVQEWNGVTSLKLFEYDAIVISDYNKGFINYGQIEIILKESQVPVFIDTKKTDLARMMGAFVKINSKEYSLAKSYCENLIVTLGGQGARYQGKIYPAPRVEVSDVCGAGDTFLAALTYQYLTTKKIETAIEFANKAGSITVQHRGNYAPTLQEIFETKRTLK
jgi:D-beta-D-heptose 7-phosphate kinase/D-beta-D-heptose 1-phosphate adenosyltransferase